MGALDTLQQLRDGTGGRETVGLPDATVAAFAESDTALRQAIGDAAGARDRLRAEFPDLVGLDERALIEVLQRGLVNFYPDDGINPYVALAARGPWIVTFSGAVLHDSGGYGMLGFGHSPDAILAAMNRPHVMANVMTPNFSQLRLVRALEREIGRSRGGCPFTRFVCMNSGSEAMTVGARIADVNTRRMTDPGGRHAGKPIRMLSLKGGFHGRTERPAQYSDSTRAGYRKHLASFRGEDALWTVPPNDIAALDSAFARADDEGVFIEAMFMEPVMGEGNPGIAVTPGFYAAARHLTRAHGSLFMVDSIQAGLRATGNLSIVDFPGFETLDAPDMETYSKALNAGQYPLSVLALTELAAGLYRKGIYGNTMTTNPRALDVAVAVLESITPELRENVRARGVEFLARFGALADESDGAITGVQGCGLLLSCELSDDYKCYGADSTEEWLRRHGIGVIHGGRNSLRFTPHFGIRSAEVELIVDMVGRALREGPRLAEPAHVEAAVSSL